MEGVVSNQLLHGMNNKPRESYKSMKKGGMAPRCIPP
jgi:hypothetical protein